MEKIFKDLTILYVEDDDSIRDNLTLSLELIFKNVFSCQNAEEALEIYNKNNYINIILSDINLPSMSGIEFVKIIRQTNPKIPIILLTAYTHTDILLEAVKLKLVNYLVKPITFDKLLATLKEAVKDISDFDDEEIYNLTPTISYNHYTKIIVIDNKEIQLTANEAKFLYLLIQNKHRPLSIDELKDAIWENNFYTTDSAFKSLLNKLRKKIGNNLIKNISKIGYTLQPNS